MALCAAGQFQRFSEVEHWKYHAISSLFNQARVFQRGSLTFRSQSCNSMSRRSAVIVRSFLQDGGTAKVDKTNTGIPEMTGSWHLLSSVSQQDPTISKAEATAVCYAEDSVLVDSVVKCEEKTALKSLVQLPAAKQFVELLTAWDCLSKEIPPEVLQCKGSQLLLSALKVSIPAFQRVPFSEDGRLHLSRALEVAYTLADLRMDAEVIAAGILRAAMDTRSISVADVQRELGSGTVHLLHDCMRVNQTPSRFESLGDRQASIVRQFSLAFHDVRALTVELASRLDAMRHIQALPRHQQQTTALENLQVYAPLAHALGLGHLSQELEDLAFKVLFPESYRYVEDWLRCHWGDGETIIVEATKKLKEALEADSELQQLTESIKVTGRCKSRFSTMKKLVKDGRKPDQVYDILGLRVVLSPKSGTHESEKQAGLRACYRAQRIVTSMWEEVPGRLKDYIAKPKANGYSSLHLAVYLTDYGPWSLPMELQVRTAAMHAHAVAGAASHALYKGGLTDLQQVQHFKAVMLAAANASAYRLQNAGCSSDHLFDMFDQNKDGIITREEFENVMVEMGANSADACRIVDLVDSNTDGSVDLQELEELQRQVRALQAGMDSKYSMKRIKEKQSSIEMKQVSVF